MLEERLNGKLERILTSLWSDLGDLSFKFDINNKEKMQEVLDSIEDLTFVNKVLNNNGYGRLNDIEKICLIKIFNIDTVKGFLHRTINEGFPLTVEIIKNLMDGVDYLHENDWWIKEYEEKFELKSLMDEDFWD